MEKINSKDKTVSIKLKNWNYRCGDGCCDMYGTELIVNGKKSTNQYTGDSVELSLKYALEELGFKVNIETE